MFFAVHTEDPADGRLLHAAPPLTLKPHHRKGLSYEFTGLHALFWQKSSADGPSNPIAKTFDAVFSAFGKLVGF